MRDSRYTHQVNSEPAGKLKAEWLKLVNMMAAVTAAANLFDTERRSHMDVRGVVDSYVDENGNYNTALRNIAEITAARSLVRPEPSGKTRKDMVVAASALIKELGATPPPKLSVLMGAFLPATGKQ